MKKITAVLLAVLMLISALAFASCEKQQPQNYKEQILSELKEYQNLDFASNTSASVGALSSNLRLDVAKLTLGGQENILPSNLTLSYDMLTSGSAMSADGSLALGDDKASLGFVSVDGITYVNIDGKDAYYKFEMPDSADASVKNVLAADYSIETVQTVYDIVLKYAVKVVESIPDTAVDTEDGYKLKLDSDVIETIAQNMINDIKADDELKQFIVDMAGTEAYDEFITALDDVDIDADGCALTVKETAQDDGTSVTEINIASSENSLLSITANKKDGNTKTDIVINELFTVTCERSVTDDGTQDTVNIAYVDSDDTFDYKANYDGNGNLTHSEMSLVIDSLESGFKVTATTDCQDGKTSFRAKIYTKADNEFSELLDIIYDEEQKDGNTSEFATTVNIKYGGVLIPIGFNGTVTANDNCIEIEAKLLCEVIGLECNVTFGADKATSDVTAPDEAKVVDGDGSELESAFEKLAEDHPELMSFISQFGGMGGTVSPGVDY